MSAVRDVLPEVEACARETFLAKRNIVKHNRGTEMFEAGNIRFGLEMRRLKNGDGGLAVHVLADIGGTPGKAYAEETELLAFDHFWQNPHYHYGPRNKNHRTNWDLTVIDDPLDLDVRAVRDRQAPRDDRARRLSGRRGRSRRGEDRGGPAGAEKAGLRDVRGRRKADRPQGIAAGVTPNLAAAEYVSAAKPVEGLEPLHPASTSATHRSVVTVPPRPRRRARRRLPACARQQMSAPPPADRR